jgi:2'-5' RNA ligase
MMYRLFVAIDLPSEAKEAILGIRSRLPGVKWVEPEQLHLTLRFIGDADQTLYNSIGENLSGIMAAPFSLTLRGVGYFPPKRDPRILWVGSDKNTALHNLRNLVEKALLQSGLEPEGRSFSPHITIARLKGMPASVLSSLLHDNALFTVSPFQVSEFILYSSILTPQGAIHRREGAYPLKG